MDEQQVNHTETPNTTTPATKPNSKKWIIIGIAVVVVLVLAQSLFSPDKIAERALERATGGAVDIDSDGQGSVKYKGANGEEVNISAGESVTLPKNWPASVPIDPDAKITYAGSMNNGQDGNALSVSYTTTRTAAQTTEYYTDELSSKGWEIGATIATGDGSMISASKNETESVVVYIGESEGLTTVTITTQVTN